MMAPLLPFNQFRHNFICNTANQTRRSVNTVNITNMILYIADRHTFLVHCKDASLHIISSGLPFFNNLRFKCSGSVPRDRAAAEAHVIQATNRTADELQQLGSGEYPAQLKQAVLLLAGHWYNQRESVAGVQMHEVPDALQALIKPFRKLAEDTTESTD